MKKILCVLLSVIFIFSMGVTAFADETQAVADAISSALTASVADSIEAEAVAAEPVIEPNAKIATMYLCTSGSNVYYIWGHAWIMIKNTSDSNIEICDMVLAPGAMMSVGLHHDGGRHFNREIVRYKGKTVKAITRDINMSELRIAEKEIMSSSWGWYEYLAHNCTNFATSVWKAVTGRLFLCFCFPFVVSIQLPAKETIKLTIN